MVQILKRPSTFGEEFGAGLGAGIGSGIAEELKFGRQKELQSLKSKKESKDLQGTYTSILDQMKDLKDYVGPAYSQLGSLNPFSETSGKRSQIDTARLSLEGLFKDLTLKGQFPKAIYERILKELPNSSDTTSKYLNKIKAIENILQSHYGKKEEISKDIIKKGRTSFDVSNPEHKRKRDQVLRDVKGDRKKAEEILSREFD